MPDRSVLGGGAGTVSALVSQVSWRLRRGAYGRGSRYGQVPSPGGGVDPDAEQIVGQVGFTVDGAAFDQFRRFLERLGPVPSQVVIDLEATGHYHLTLVEYLVDLGYQVA